MSSTGEDLSSYEQNSIEQEQRLVDDITAPGGVRAAPPRESLNKFVARYVDTGPLSLGHWVCKDGNGKGWNGNGIGKGWEWDKIRHFTPTPDLVVETCPLLM